ncbi:hypothetical protein ACFTUC_34520 [Streptomyces sp. NPDC056944]|uniref:hypothetical protein n=1 Tax=Streptomyces sp. NPDC056944 TaxID=3345972 RepID=UPI00363EE20F
MGITSRVITSANQSKRSLAGNSPADTTDHIARPPSIFLRRPECSGANAFVAGFPDRRGAARTHRDQRFNALLLKGS